MNKENNERNQNHQLNWWYAPALKGHIAGSVSRRTEHSVSRITCPATGKPVSATHSISFELRFLLSFASLNTVAKAFYTHQQSWWIIHAKAPLKTTG